MSNLYIINEIFTSGLNYNSLNIISTISILCGLFVIVTKNPIVSVLFLIGLFISIATYLMMLGINFIGLSYLLVYVGAVSILFLFILMLINVRVSELVTDNSNSIPLAILTGIFFNLTLSNLLPSNVTINSGINLSSGNRGFLQSGPITEKSNNSILSYISSYFWPKNGDIALGMGNTHNADLCFVTSQIWDGALAESSHITSIGNIIYTSYPLWLILTSIILLLAMVGAIVITKK